MTGFVKKVPKIVGKGGLTVILVALLALLLAISFSNSRKKDDQLKQMKEQLEMQQEVIDALREQKNENDSFIKDSVPVITSEQLKSELSSIRELVTQRYIYTNSDKFEKNQTWIFGWDRPFSEKSLLVTYDGTIKAGVDLNDVQIDVDEEKHAIKVVLPPSKITSNEIPQETISVLQVKDGLFNEITLDDYNELISNQKLIMENKAVERGLLEEADTQAKSIVKDFLSQIPGVGDPYTLTIEQTQR